MVRVLLHSSSNFSCDKGRALKNEIVFDTLSVKPVFLYLPIMVSLQIWFDGKFLLDTNLFTTHLECQDWGEC